jgi:hypothetical protein
MPDYVFGFAFLRKTGTSTKGSRKSVLLASATDKE